MGTNFTQLLCRAKDIKILHNKLVCRYHMMRTGQGAAGGGGLDVQGLHDELWQIKETIEAVRVCSVCVCVCVCVRVCVCVSFSFILPFSHACQHSTLLFPLTRVHT